MSRGADGAPVFSRCIVGGISLYSVRRCALRAGRHHAVHWRGRDVCVRFLPVGLVDINGQVLSINQYQALFALLGTTYGGDGQTTFALPTAKPIFTATGAVLLQCIALQGVFPSRN